VGVFRLASEGRNGRRGGGHRAPDFEHWAETVPANWRIVVLCFHGGVHVDENAVHGLRAGVLRLRREGRSLVLAGVSPSQYAAFEKFGAFRVLSRDDVWSDIEFALARAASLAEAAAPGA
jgi:anti-anti-sigma regulatory factor